MSTDDFVTFYHRYYRLILTIAQQRLPNMADAEDVTAEVFRIAWVRHQGDVTVSLPWTYQVLRNVIGNEYRRSSRAPEPTTATGTDQIGDDWTGPASDAAEVRAGLHAIPAADRELLFMAYWEDLTREEMAAILGCSVRTARVRLFRARRRLATQLRSSDGATSIVGGPSDG